MPNNVNAVIHMFSCSFSVFDGQMQMAAVNPLDPPLIQDARIITFNDGGDGGISVTIPMTLEAAVNLGGKLIAKRLVVAPASAMPKFPPNGRPL